MDALLQSFDSLSARFPIMLNFAGNLLAGFVIFIVGLMVGRWVRRRIRKSKIGGAHLDPTLKPVIASALFYIIIAMTLYAVLIKVGVPATSLIAVFGAAGIAIGLSLKDTLSNIAAGIMLLLLRPLEVGEYVELAGSAGTVKEVGLFATTLKTSDGIYQFIPNSQIWDARITNYGRHSIRRFLLDIGVSYDTDLRKAQEVIMETLKSAEGWIEDAASPPEIYVTTFGDFAITLSARIWLPGNGWSARCSELRVEIFEALKKAEIDVPVVKPAISS